jgi:D-alanyl-D-alanine dipeptidase
MSLPYPDKALPNFTVQRAQLNQPLPPIKDNDEDCAAADGAPWRIAGSCYYAETNNPPYFAAAPGARKQILLRTGVLNRLQIVNQELNKSGLEIFCYDGWRPQSVQRYYRNVWVPDYLRRKNPALSESEIQQQASIYWSTAYPSEDEVPKDNPPPHSTGGALDVTIRTIKTGEPLFMGSTFDDPFPISMTEHFEINSGDPSTTEMARAHRRLLYWAMTEAGFVNYPNEWWHYSYGDQEWAAQTGSPFAIYGKWNLIEGKEY